MAHAREVLAALERADAALERSAGATALQALLDAWRLHRTPELAELVEQLSVRVAATRSLPKVKTQKQELLDWIACARKRDAADLHLLLDTFARMVERGHKHAIKAALEELAQWRDDPRLSARIKRLSVELPYSSWLMLRLAHVLMAAGDPATLPSSRGRTRGFAAELEARRRSLPGPIERDAEHDAALADAQALLLARIAAATLDPAADPLPSALPKTRAQLFDEVYANPADELARAVLGDFLMAQGDPWGELISLQLARLAGEPSRAARARERALLDAHAMTWLGPLARLVRKRGLVFERGFPAALVLRPQSSRLVVVEQAHREWSTIERVEFAPRVQGSATFTSPHMRAIRELDGLCDAGFVELASKHAQLPVEHVVYRPDDDWQWSPRVLEALRECEGLERLGSLWIRRALTPDQLAWLWATPLGHRLHTLHFESRYGLHEWCGVPTHVRRIVEHRGDSWWMLERDPRHDTRFARLHVYLADDGTAFNAMAPLVGLADDLDAIQVEKAEHLGARGADFRAALSRFQHARIEFGVGGSGSPAWRSPLPT